MVNNNQPHQGDKINYCIRRYMTKQSGVEELERVSLGVGICCISGISWSMQEVYHHLMPYRYDKTSVSDNAKEVHPPLLVIFF